MRLKKFMSAILSLVMVFTLFGGAMTTSAATRHYFASTLYFAMYEQTNSPKYSGYDVDYMEMATAGLNDKVMADAQVMGVRKDGSIGG